MIYYPLSFLPTLENEVGLTSNDKTLNVDSQMLLGGVPFCYNNFQMGNYFQMSAFPTQSAYYLGRIDNFVPDVAFASANYALMGYGMQKCSPLQEENDEKQESKTDLKAESDECKHFQSSMTSFNLLENPKELEAKEGSQMLVIDREHQDSLNRRISGNEQEKEDLNLSNYPKKNTESNIVNQIFSYISSECKSRAIVEAHLLNDKKKVQSFYHILNEAKKRKKKYINRKYLSNLCTIKPSDIGYKMLVRARNRLNVLSVAEFQKVLRILIMYYLKKQSEANIITSKKISRATYMEHLERRKEIKIFLAEKFTEIYQEQAQH